MKGLASKAGRPRRAASGQRGAVLGGGRGELTPCTRFRYTDLPVAQRRDEVVYVKAPLGDASSTCRTP